MIRIHRQDEDTKKEKVIMLTSSQGTGLSEDIQLTTGDTVEVDSIPSSSFTVIGLVNTPGRFDYQQGGQVNLIQALAYAGGINWIADPKFMRGFTGRTRFHGQSGDGGLQYFRWEDADGGAPPWSSSRRRRGGRGADGAERHPCVVSGQDDSGKL